MNIFDNSINNGESPITKHSQMITQCYSTMNAIVNECGYATDKFTAFFYASRLKAQSAFEKILLPIYQELLEAFKAYSDQTSSLETRTLEKVLKEAKVKLVVREKKCHEWSPESVDSGDDSEDDTDQKYKWLAGKVKLGDDEEEEENPLQVDCDTIFYEGEDLIE